MVREAAKSYPGAQFVRSEVASDGERAIERTHQEADYGRQGKGSIFGAFPPASGAALTVPYSGRTIANGTAFLEQVECVYAVLDNLSTHHATDVLLFSLGHPRWEFVFQPTATAYLNVIEPWWKGLRSLALMGRRLESWEEVCQAVQNATSYGNAHRHPFVWGNRHRGRPRLARLATIA